MYAVSLDLPRAKRNNCTWGLKFEGGVAELTPQSMDAWGRRSVGKVVLYEPQCREPPQIEQRLMFMLLQKEIV